MLTREQLRLAIGDELFDSIPDAPGRRPSRRPLRPRSERNQTWLRVAAGGLVPARVAHSFTLAERAVLYVLAAECQLHGRCLLTVGEIARRANCCRTVVQNTLRRAIRLELIAVEQRRVSWNRNDSNVVRIANKTWIAWIRLAPRQPRPWGQGGLMTVSRDANPYNKEGGRLVQAGPQSARNGRWRVLGAGGPSG